MILAFFVVPPCSSGTRASVKHVPEACEMVRRLFSNRTCDHVARRELPRSLLPLGCVVFVSISSYCVAKLSLLFTSKQQMKLTRTSSFQCLQPEPCQVL